MFALYTFISLYWPRIFFSCPKFKVRNTFTTDMLIFEIEISLFIIIWTWILSDLLAHLCIIEFRWSHLLNIIFIYKIEYQLKLHKIFRLNLSYSVLLIRIHIREYTPIYLYYFHILIIANNLIALKSINFFVSKQFYLISHFQALYNLEMVLKLA